MNKRVVLHSTRNDSQAVCSDDWFADTAMNESPEQRALLEKLISRATRASGVGKWTPLQSLWSGYGQIWRVDLLGCAYESLIVKQVRPPEAASQPRGWNTDQSHQRKLRSYEVEARWYQNWSQQLDNVCRVATCLGVSTDLGGHVFLLEDLDATGFASRWTSPPIHELQVGLQWLARFHMKFLQCEPKGLWEVGTYWHLATRPEELAAIPNLHPLKQHAYKIDRRLSQCRFPTILHGDAKIANFCVAPDGQSVAAVDFQYVGGGCAMKDVIYFLGSALSERELEAHAEALLNHYLTKCHAHWPLSEDQWSEFELECRTLYPFAWADFQRFLVGWFPQHTKLHGYSQRMTQHAMNQLSALERDA